MNKFVIAEAIALIDTYVQAAKYLGDVSSNTINPN